MCLSSAVTKHTARISIALRRARAATDILGYKSTDALSNDGIDVRENRRRQAHLLHLPKDVQAKASHDNGCNVDTTCPGLHRLEQELKHSCEKRRIPWHQAVN